MPSYEPDPVYFPFKTTAAVLFVAACLFATGLLLRFYA